jgi:hypothetical protein
LDVKYGESSYIFALKTGGTIMENDKIGAEFLQNLMNIRVTEDFLTLKYGDKIISLSKYESGMRECADDRISAQNKLLEGMNKKS